MANLYEPAHLTAADRRAKADQAQARSHAYLLFSRFFREGMTEELAPYARALPGLEAVKYPGPDEAAAGHYRLFGYNVFPYESAFLQPEFHLGGEVAGRVAVFYQEVGYVAPGWNEPPDHVSRELGALAFLSGAEADAWEDGLWAEAGRMTALACRFLDGHVLHWLPGLELAIRQQDGALEGEADFFSVLAGLAVELAFEHRRALGNGRGSDAEEEFPLAWSGTLASPDLSRGQPGGLQETGALSLDDPRTGLKEIAAYLLAPARSGLYLSRDDISRLARDRGLPRGFGGRRQMLVNLLRTAADYGELGAVVGALSHLAGVWQAAYAARLEVTPGIPGLAPIAARWQVRLAETQALLDRLEGAVREGAAQGEGY